MHNEEHKDEGGNNLGPAAVGAIIGGLAVVAGAAWLASDEGKKFLQGAEGKLNELKEKFEAIRADVGEAFAQKIEDTRNDIANKIKQAREDGEENSEKFVQMIKDALATLEQEVGEAETKVKASKA